MVNGTSPFIECNVKDNITHCPDSTVLEWSKYLDFPCPIGMMWICGQHSYLNLPSHWSGICYLFISVHGVMRVNETYVPLPMYHRQKRNRISPRIKADTGLVSILGPVQLAYEIDSLGVDLENLTLPVELRFDTLTAEVKALRMMAQQICITLDLLLAEREEVSATL